MTLEEIKKEFSQLPKNYKTKDVDKLNRRLIKEKQDVSCLKDLVLSHQEYHRTYFQVSLGQMKTNEEKFKFIEDNFLNLSDWWHVDQLTQFINKIDPQFALKKAKKYVNSSLPFARRWGYVLFMPTLVKNEEIFNQITKLIKNDEEYYVIMAEAWLISYLAIYFPERTFTYLNQCELDYSIVSRAIQKICDSYQVSQENKNLFKSLRVKYKKTK